MSLFNEEERKELKELIAELTAKGDDPQDAQRKAAEEIAAKAKKEGAEPEADPAIKALEEKIDAIGKSVADALQVAEDTPAIKNVGYFSHDGGEADPEVKSLGDFFLAVKREDTKRLTKIYGSRKDIQSQDGPAGGYLVPSEFHPQLMEATARAAVIRPRAQIIPVSSDTGRVPSLDQTNAPTAGAGDSAYAGGVVANWVAAGGTITETQPTFEQIEYVIRKLAGYTEVESEVVADSAIAIEAMLTRLFGRAVASMEDHAFIRGDGVQEPLGILNAACTIGVTTATNNVFAYADALAMRARFQGMGGQPVWIIHPGVWPDIGVFEIGTGGGVWQANARDAMAERLLGYPILESEHMPQDDNDDAILADLSAYVIFDRAGIAVAFSEHAAFTSDKGTWRVTKRMDGQPWLHDPITLADPQGSYTVSPFVYHDD